MVNATLRKRLAALVAAGLCLVLGACGTSTSSKPSGESGGNSVITVNNVEPAQGLIPTSTNDLAGWKIVTQLFEGLVTFSNTGALIYADAQSITPNADATQFTITLRPGLVFSDGTPITAETYARSWSFGANAANGQTGSAGFSTIEGYDRLQDEHGDPHAQLSGLKAIDARTLQVTMATPDSSFPYKVGDVAFLPIPTASLDHIEDFGKHPVGNGPYRLASWDHDQAIRLVPNPHYTGPRKAVNAGVTYRLYTQLDSAYSDLESGNLDVLDTIPNSALTTYQYDDRITAFNKPGPGFKSFTIPQNLAHFSEEEGQLRRTAISLSIDRKTIVTKVLHGTAEVATDFTAPTITGHNTTLKGSDVLRRNATKAKELWKRADAMSPWGGTFRLAYSADSGNKPWVEAITNAVSNTLGISASPYAFPTQKEFSGAVHDRTIHAAFTQGMQSDYPHPEGYLVQAYSSASADGKGLNNGDYRSAAFDRFMDRAARETKLESSLVHYHASQELLLHDLPVIPLWYANVTAGAGKQMRHVSFNYMGVPEYYRLTK